MKTPLWRRLLRIQAHLAHLAERLKSRTIAEDAPGETPAVSTSTSGSSREATEELQSQGERSTETPDREHEHAYSTCRHDLLCGCRTAIPTKTPLWRRLLRVRAHLVRLAQRLKCRTIAKALLGRRLMRVRAPRACLAVRLKSRNPRESAPQRHPTASMSTPARLAVRLRNRNIGGGAPVEAPAVSTSTSGSSCSAVEEPHIRRRRSWGNA